MKKVYIILLIVSIMLNISIIKAQSPQAFKYQAIARGSTGNILANQNVRFRMSILQGSASGSSVFVETHFLTTNAFGMADLNIGNGTCVSGNFSTISWGNNSYFLKVELDPSGGTTYTTMGTTQLLSVPYALYAGSAGGNSWNSNGNNIYNNNIGNVGIGTNSPTSKLVIKQTTTNINDTLFVVKDNLGHPVFAVFPQGVRVYVPDLLTGTVGGFAVSGRGATKGSGNYLMVNHDSTRIYTNDTIKGFGVGNIYTGSSENYLKLTPSNYFIGHKAGDKNTNGYQNIFLGYESGRNNLSGSVNVYIGYKTGSTSNASENVFVGSLAGYNCTNGGRNVLVGNGAGYTLFNGANNIVIGSSAGSSVQGGSNNVFIGSAAGANNNGGSGNVFIGSNAGFDETGSDKLIIGKNAETGPAAFIFGNFNTNQLNLANTFVGDVGYGSTVACFSHRSSANLTGFALAQSNDGKKTIVNIASGNGWLGFRIDNVDKAFLYNNGYFGIGLNPVTDPPTQMLDVNGNARFRGIQSGYPGVPLYVTAGGSLSLTSSDERLKEHIKPLKNCLEKVLTLQPKTYSYIKDETKAIRIGFIAQDMEKIFPELVFTNPVDGFKGVYYAELSAVLAEAIKEQQKQIELLQNENKQLKNKVNDIDNLKAEVDKLKEILESSAKK